MKKTYMNPTLEVVVLKYNNSLLAGSPDGNNMVDPESEAQNPSVFEGRYFDFDEEDEY